MSIDSLHAVQGARETRAPDPAAVAARVPDGERRPPRLLHHLFSARAARTPDAVALVAGGERVTYAELEARANRLAQSLRARGVGREVRVGLCLERGAGLVAALLGVLKAGGAYVPLDPGHPADRLRQVLQDSRAALVLTESPLAERVGGTGAPLLLLDRVAAEIAAQPAEAPESGVRPENLAYVAYTSGSTGRPKGVLGTHGQAADYVESVVDVYGLRPCAAVLQVATVTVDASLREIFGAFAVGARLVLLPQEGAADARVLLERIRAERVEGVWAMVPSFLQVVVATAEEAAWTYPSVRSLLVAGEPLPQALAARARAVFPGARLINQYGPTETTVTATWQPSTDEGDGIVALGRPVPGMRVHVLDAGMSPVAPGLPGEAYIGGAGVTRGYADQPGLTAAAFVPDPFSRRPGARLYRTGDRVCRRADGALEFLGRMDFQVKVRGFRVEPGEVEAALHAHPDVRQAVVGARGDGADRRLVAWVTARGPAPSEASLRAHLDGLLPAYMVPAAFVALDRLPLTPGGKVDRAALPAPVEGAGAAAYAAPAGATEPVLAGIWAEVLRRERVGRDDGFFALGGHSLLATRVIGRVRDAFGVELPFEAFFETREVTLAALSARVEALTAAGVVRLSGLAIPAGEADQALLDRMDDLSEAELDRLLCTLSESEA